MREEQPHEVIRPVEVDRNLLDEILRRLVVKLYPIHQYQLDMPTVKTYRPKPVSPSIVDQNICPTMQFQSLSTQSAISPPTPLKRKRKTRLLNKSLTPPKFSNITLYKRHISSSKPKTSLLQLGRWRRPVVSQDQLCPRDSKRLGESSADCSRCAGDDGYFVAEGSPVLGGLDEGVDVGAEAGGELGGLVGHGCLGKKIKCLMIKPR